MVTAGLALSLLVSVGVLQSANRNLQEVSLAWTESSELNVRQILPPGSGLMTKQVTVEAETSLQEVLRVNHVVVNGDALATCFILNTKLQNDKVDSGTRLTIPTFGRQLAAIVPDGAYLYIVLNGSIKRDILRHCESIDRQLLSFPGKAFTQDSDLIGRLKVLVQKVRSECSSDAAVTTRSYLEQTSAFLNEIDLLLSKENAKTPEEEEKFKILVLGLEEMLSNYDSARGDMRVYRWKERVVSVKIANSQKVVKICYAPKALYPEKRNEFARNTPNATEALPIATYKFWGEDPLTNQKVTDIKVVKVLPSKDILVVDLLYEAS